MQLILLSLIPFAADAFSTSSLVFKTALMPFIISWHSKKRSQRPRKSFSHNSSLQCTTLAEPCRGTACHWVISQQARLNLRQSHSFKVTQNQIQSSEAKDVHASLAALHPSSSRQRLKFRVKRTSERNRRNFRELSCVCFKKIPFSLAEELVYA